MRNEPEISRNGSFFYTVWIDIDQHHRTNPSVPEWEKVEWKCYFGRILVNQAEVESSIQDSQTDRWFRLHTYTHSHICTLESVEQWENVAGKPYFPGRKNSCFFSTSSPVPITYNHARVVVLWAIHKYFWTVPSVEMKSLYRLGSSCTNNSGTGLGELTDTRNHISLLLVPARGHHLAIVHMLQLCNIWNAWETAENWGNGRWVERSSSH